MFGPNLQPGLTLADRVLAAPSSSHVAVARVAEGAGWKRTGIVVGRAWPSGFDAREYLLLLTGGRKDRLARPDGVGWSGQPIYLLSERERKLARKLLDRHCLDGFESVAGAPCGPLVRKRNVACNDGRALLLNFLITASGYTGAQYFAVGTGISGGAPVSPSSTDHQLGFEVFRKAPTSYVVSGNQALIATFFDTFEGNFTYTEAGLFGSAPGGYSGGQSTGGVAASGTANTGIFYAHASYSYTKTSSITLTNDYYLYEN